jgi:hypothetical protein
LPEPEAPTIAVEVPALISKFTPCSVSGIPSGAVGYLKWTPLNSMPCFKFIISFPVLPPSVISLISDYLSTTSKIFFPTTRALERFVIFGNMAVNCPIPIRIAYTIETTSSML